MSDKFLKVKDNGAEGLALVRAEAEDVAEELGVDDLKTHIDDLNNIVLIDLGELVDDSYVNSSTGIFGSFSGYKRTGYLPILSTKLAVCVTSKATNTGVAFYDKNKAYISGVNFHDYTYQSMIVLNVPDNANYFAYCALEESVNLMQASQNNTSDVNERIQARFTGLENDIAGQNSKYIGKAYSVIFTDGIYIKATNGNEGESSGYSATDYVPLFGNGIYLTEYYSDLAGLAFYNENKIFISGHTRTADNEGGFANISVPENSVYFRVCCKTNQKVNFYLLDNSASAMQNMASRINGVVSDIKNNFAALPSAYIGKSYVLNLTDGKYINANNGNEANGAAYSDTDYIPIFSSKIALTEYYSDSAGLAFYDKRKSYISGHTRTVESEGEIAEVSVPENAVYFRVCCKKNQKANFRMVDTSEATMQATVGNILANIGPSLNPCFYKESDECAVFKKILCIGDSLTAGQFDYKDSGVIREFNNPDYAYPAFLQALTGRNTTNAGDAGKTTVSWYAAHENDDLSGHDACIIMLGRNDYVSGRETTSEQRAQAFSNIITKVRTENPQIKIFISTLINYYINPSRSDYEDALQMNDDIRAAATANNCYLLDISEYGQMTISGDAYSHCTAAGYHKLAEYFYNYISYIIHNNYTQFKNVQYAGTDYSW